MPTFSQDIRPLFRDFDIEEMRFAFNLDDYDDVKTHAQAIYAALEDRSMPCDDPWSEEQIALFKQWMETGYAR